MNNQASSYLTPAMHDLANTEGSNQATDYLRLQNEIALQQRILDAQRKKQNSFGQRVLRGLTSAIPGAIAGIPGGPAGIAAGAGAGFASGALAPVGTDTSALGVMAANMAGHGSSYLSNPSIPKNQAPGTVPMQVGQPGGLNVPLNMNYPDANAHPNKMYPDPESYTLDPNIYGPFEPVA